MGTVAFILAILAGLTVLIGYFVPVVAPIQSIVLNWSIILAGVAALVGVGNLLLVHGNKITRREKGAVYSGLLIVSLLGTFFSGLVVGPDNAGMQWLVRAVIVPVEATLLALLAVTLLYASVRLLRRRTSVMSVVFLVAALLMLLASATLPFGQFGLLNDVMRPWFQHVLAMGGARGILLGVALGTLTTGLRVLFGTERPYGGK